jgi:hypothetical protein
MRPTPIFLWDSVANLVYDRTGAVRDTVGEFSGMDIYATPIQTGDVLFGRFTVSALHQNELYISDGGPYEVRVYGMSGDLRRIIRLERAPRKVTNRDEEVMRAAYLERASGPDSRRRIERYLREWPRAEHKPWLSRLLVDGTGHIWVEEYEPYWARSARTWGVFNPAGQWLGTLQAPAGLRIMEIGPDYVLGTWMTELNVEQVRLYGLVRN